MTSTNKEDDLIRILGKTLSSNEVKQIKNHFCCENVEFESKELGGVLYKSIKSLGISFQFERSKTETENRICQAIDLYNEKYGKGWKSYSKLPLNLIFLSKGSDTNQDTKSQQFQLTSHTCGIDWVKFLGEPDRKGGGEPLKGGGASGLGPGAWMEWKRVKIKIIKTQDQELLSNKSFDENDFQMIDINVELTGSEVRGEQRWEKERAGSAFWGVITFSVSSSPP